MSAPYYVALHGGFLVVEGYDTPTGWREKAYTVSDCRLATPYPSFEKADAVAKWATGHLYPPDLRYFALLQVANGSDITLAQRVIGSLVGELEYIGFGTDDDISGAEAVNVVNEHWDNLQLAKP